MSKTLDLLLRDGSEEEQLRYFGVIPDQKTKKKVLRKLKNFGKGGTKGFDMSIATYAIIRGIEEHEKLPIKNYDTGAIETFARPFTFASVSIEATSFNPDADSQDHGTYNGFTYGLHILPKTLDVEYISYKADWTVTALARHSTNNSNSDRTLVSQKIARPEQASIVTPYGDHFPDNFHSFCAYLVLPTVEAVELIGNQVTSLSQNS